MCASWKKLHIFRFQNLFSCYSSVLFSFFHFATFRNILPVTKVKVVGAFNTACDNYYICSIKGTPVWCTSYTLSYFQSQLVRLVPRNYTHTKHDLPLPVWCSLILILSGSWSLEICICKFISELQDQVVLKL